jgi:pimeloyl-ACP methyl ester carboxylesterase
MDLVFVPGWISNIEMAWELPEFARFLGRLASFARLIWFDKRGTGLSDRVAGPVTLEARSDDIRAVMDAAGSDQAALVGWYEGGAIAANFAATYPARVRALVIGSFTARAAHDVGEPWGIDPGMMAVITERVEDAWGTAAIAELVSPSTIGDARFLAFWRRYERASASPNAAGIMIRWNLAIDVRAALPAISSPTLVIHRKDIRLVPAAAVRHVAGQIAGSRYLELGGQDMFPFVGDSEAVLDAIQEFVTGAPPPADADRVLATCLFTDVVGSTQTLGRIGDRAWSDLLQSHARQSGTHLSGSAAGRSIPQATGSSPSSMGPPGRCGAQQKYGIRPPRSGLNSASVSTPVRFAPRARGDRHGRARRRPRRCPGRTLSDPRHQHRQGSCPRLRHRLRRAMHYRPQRRPRIMAALRIHTYLNQDSSGKEPPAVCCTREERCPANSVDSPESRSPERLTRRSPGGYPIIRAHNTAFCAPP